MKVLKGIYKQGEEGETETIKIKWDFSISGCIEVVRAESSDDALIKVPGELVSRFLEAYLHERKIDVLKILPDGYIK